MEKLLNVITIMMTLTVLLIPMPRYQTLGQSGNWVRYEDPYWGFSINYPSDWKLQNSPYRDFGFRIGSPDLTVDPLGHLTNGAFLAVFVREITEKQWDAYVSGRHGKITIAGKTGFQSAGLDGDGYPFVEWVVFAYQHAHLFRLVSTSHEVQEQQFPIIQDMLQSLSFTGEYAKQPLPDYGKLLAGFESFSPIKHAFDHGPGKIVKGYGSGVSCGQGETHCGGDLYALDVCPNSGCVYNGFVIAPTDIKLILSLRSYQGAPTEDFHIFEIDQDDSGHKLCMSLGHFGITLPGFTVGKSVPRGALIGRLINYPTIPHIHMGIWYHPSNCGDHNGRVAIPYTGIYRLDNVEYQPGENYVGKCVTSTNAGICVSPFSGYQAAITAQDDCIPELPSPQDTDSATFISDITLPDGTIVSPGQALHKIWRVRNSGTSTWNSGYELVFVGGDQMGASNSVPVPTIAPGATADVAVDIIAPSAPGTYVGYWQLRNDQGVFFGPRLWIKIQVPSESTQEHITVFAFDPPSPSGADVVRIHARVENFPNFRAMRVRVGDGVLCELGSPEIACEWHTAGYADGAHTVMVEVADQTDTSWDHPERRVATYVLEGPRSSSNHGPDRPAPQGPYDWYVTIGSPPELCVNPVADPEGDPVQYYFETQASVGSANSGWMGNPCWTPPSSLAPGTYEWRVKARDSHGAESGWSDSWHYSIEASGVTINDIHFQELDPAQEQVRIFACTEGHAGVNITLNVRVNDAPDGSDSGQWHIIKELGVPCFNDVDVPVWNTLAFPDGDHLVRVVATAIEPAASDVRDEVYHLNHRRPAGPELLAPVNSEDVAQIIWLNSRTVTFRWRSGAIPGTPDRTSSYRLRVSTNPDPAVDPIADVSLGSSTTSYIYTFSSDHPHLYWHVVASNDVGSTASGTAHIGIDRNPPSSQVQALPAATADNVFVVRWGGSDDRSGIRWYDVQVRDGERGEWRDWLVNTTETFALFTGHPGHTYYFRCRAQDNAGNREEYPTGDGDTFTLLDPTSRPSEPWWNGAYSAKRNLVTLNNDDDTLSAGYPVHLHFDDTTNPTASELYNASLSSTKGDDFRIVYNNATELDRVVQSFSPSAIDIWFRTQAAIEPAMADTISYQLYYGNPAVTNPPANPNNVWYPALDTYTRVLLRMQEGTGTTVGDSSGYGNHCTFGSTALSWTTGKFGATVVHFPGHNPDGPALDCGRNGLDLGAFTIEMWIKRNSLQQGDGRLAGQLESGHPPKYLFSLFGDQLRLDIWPCTTCGSSEVRSDGRIQDTNWHHVAVTFDGGNQVAFYIDGALDSVKTLAQTGWSPSGARLQVGGAENITRFDGEMSFFRLSNVVRTSFPYGSFAAIGDEPEVGAESEVGYEPPPSGSPDLVVEDVTAYPADASLGGGLLVQAVVRNTGDGPTQKGFYTDLYLDHQPTGAGDYQGSVRFWIASPIEAGATVTLTTVLTDVTGVGGLSTAALGPLSETSVTLYIQADSSGVVSETDNLDNISTGLDVCIASADAYESDDLPAEARPIASDGTQRRNFDSLGDQDWVKFTAQGGVTYTIQTSNLGPAADTYLYLYDTDGSTLLAANDDYDGSLASHIEWRAPVTGAYYLLVKHWNPDVAGCGTAYDLTMMRALTNKMFLPVIFKSR